MNFIYEMVVERSVYLSIPLFILTLDIDCSKEHIFDESCSLNIRIANADNSNDKQNENFCRRKTKGFFD